MPRSGNKSAGYSVQSLKEHFLLNPEVTYLNHAAYGATPRPVFEAYQRWQRLLEFEPVDFLSRNSAGYLAHSRSVLAAYLNTQRDNIVYVANGTVGLNIICHGMRLRPGDEVLTSDHEHGGIDRLWRYMAQRQGFSWIVRPISIPVTTHDEFINHFWHGVTDRTRVIVLSHFTSPSSLLFPVREICRRARAAGILTVIDGSHVPGQFDLSLADLDPDFYVGIAHKWLCAPKGCAFLYARPAVQDLLDPLVISWGWEPRNPGSSKFVEFHEWQGSRDISSFLAVPDAIQFQEEHDWPSVRAYCRNLAVYAQNEIHKITGMAPWHPSDPAWHGQVVCAPLPLYTDEAALIKKLRFEYQIDVSVDRFKNRPRVRVSVQGYNTVDDIEHLLTALRRLL